MGNPLLKVFNHGAEAAHLSMSATVIRAVLNEPDLPDTGRAVDFATHDVELDHVSFGYGDHDVLTDVTFTAQAGEVTGSTHGRWWHWPAGAPPPSELDIACSTVPLGQSMPTELVRPPSRQVGGRRGRRSPANCRHRSIGGDQTGPRQSVTTYNQATTA